MVRDKVEHFIGPAPGRLEHVAPIERVMLHGDPLARIQRPFLSKMSRLILALPTSCNRAAEASRCISRGPS